MAQTRMMVAILRQTSGKSGATSRCDAGTRRFRVIVGPHLRVLGVMLELGGSESTSRSDG